jgi:N-acetylmuramoyl-L-alanine amidase
MKDFLVILDAGHGPETKGKRSPIWEDGRQLFEYEFNRDIVQRIASFIKKLGLDVFLVHDHDVDTPLYKRTQRANEAAKAYTKSVYISVHANLGGGTGWEVFTSPGETKSDEYATIFYEEALKEFPEMEMRLGLEDGDPDKEAKFYVLVNTSMPAVLTENFFMDTLVPDCELLMSEMGRKRIAKYHNSALFRILKKELSLNIQNED